MNYLTAAEVKLIVHYAGSHIRRFLGNSAPEKFSGECQKAITAFHQDPGDFSDEALLEKGANVDDAHQYTVRIELRGINPKGAAQVVAKGIWGPSRDKVIIALRGELKCKHPILVRTAGSSSFEFNRVGVDKSLPIRFLRARFEQVLDQMQYVPGSLIDSRKSRTVIAADGDGTIYDGPKTTHLPELKDSPVYGPWMNYIKAGGIFMLVSGNDMNRSFNRVINGLPQEYYGRVLLAANGGADLAMISTDGKPTFITDFRNKALSIVEDDIKHPKLDIFYIGDDGSPNGNDFAAFKAVGPDHAVLVRTILDTRLFLEKWINERKIHPS